MRKNRVRLHSQTQSGAEQRKRRCRLREYVAKTGIESMSLIAQKFRILLQRTEVMKSMIQTHKNTHKYTDMNTNR